MKDEEKEKSNNDNLCDHITICKVGFPHYIGNCSSVLSFLTTKYCIIRSLFSRGKGHKKEMRDYLYLH